MFFDTHAHLADPALLPLWEESPSLLERAWSASVRTILNISIDLASWERAQLWREKYADRIFHAAAVHPSHVREDVKENFFSKVSQAAEQGELVAIGETGMDRGEHSPSLAWQELSFRRHIHLARAHSLPLIVHCRNAYEDIRRILENEDKRGTVRGVLHCFTGNRQEAQFFLDRGWFLSLSGILTFGNAEKLRETVRSLPLRSLLLETDAPYLSPHPYRKEKLNRPDRVVEVARVLAELYQISLEEVARQTTENGRSLFALPRC